LEIIVCVKQVPEATEVQIDPAKGTLIRDGVPATVNPFDLYAVEEALRLRERYGGSVTAISMGPPQAQSALRDVIALGCDGAVLLSDRLFAGSDTLATSYALACGIRKRASYDLILCGLKTTDGDTGQVGPGLAEELGIPSVCYVRRIVEVDGGHMTVERTLDDTYETVHTPMPCLITVTKEINTPRLASLKGKLAARKATIPTWKPQDIGADPKRLGSEGSPTWVVKVFHPSTQRAAEILQGGPESQAEQLIAKLRQRHVL